MTSIKEKDTSKININEALNNLLTSSGSGGDQYVTFAIGAEDYGIEIKSIQEITAYRELTNLPQSPNYIRGILNLRGHVIPIMDSRIRFGMERTDYDKNSVIVIFMVEDKLHGMIVDRINDVMSINEDEIQATPEIEQDINTDFIAGIGKIGERFIIILDVSKLSGIPEDSLLQEEVKQAA